MAFHCGCCASDAFCARHCVPSCAVGRVSDEQDLGVGGTVRIRLADHETAIKWSKVEGSRTVHEPSNHWLIVKHVPRGYGRR